MKLWYFLLRNGWVSVRRREYGLISNGTRLLLIIWELKLEEGDLVVAEDLEKRIVKKLALARKERKEEWLVELPIVKVVLYNQ